MDSMSFILFGATGDLAKRKIFPALFNLYIENKLPKAYSIIGLGRKEFTPESFRKYVKENIMEFSRQTSQEAELERFLELIHYSVLNVDNKEDYQKLLATVGKLEKEKGIKQNRMFYLSVAPNFFDLIASNIKESGLGNTDGWKRLIIEKPFGRDLESARELNEQLSKSFAEEEVYRIDHYLGKGMVQNLDTLRFSNAILEPLWNKNYIDNIQITASETVGVEERAGYYDHSGAIRDMIQNHMMQMFMLVAMDRPTGGSTIHDEKKKVLESVRSIGENEVKNNVIRAQYDSGTMNGKEVTGYLNEPGITPDSKTDTYIALKLLVDNERWSGVPFYIRTGKRLKEKTTKIVVQFKPLEGSVENQLQPNLLIIEINPTEGVKFKINSKSQLQSDVIESIETSYNEASTKNVPEAYERLIYDALIGNNTYFSKWEEVEHSWKLVQPILNMFQKDVPLHKYASGTFGPKASDLLLQEQDFNWWN
ncbi:glucose-6-phosphate dehydrogenase [Priestia aryabhattai]